MHESQVEACRCHLCIGKTLANEVLHRIKPKGKGTYIADHVVMHSSIVGPYAVSNNIMMSQYKTHILVE